MNLSDLIAITSPVKVHAARCIHQFSPRATCRKCLRSCPNGSIQLQGRMISVEACDGCGRCIQACSQNVFEMDFPDAIAMPEGTGPLILACRKEDFPDQPVLATGCLQQFTWLQLAMLVHRFGEVVLYADQTKCADCENDWYPEAQITLMERYGLSDYAKQIRIFRESDTMRAFLAETYGDLNTRREYMRKQLAHVKEVAEKYTRQSLEGYLEAFRETVHPAQALDFEKTQSQTMLLHELFADNTFDENERVCELPLEMLAASRCRFCKTCEMLCPWQALAVIEKDGNAALVHHDVLCARCGLCIDICPENALHWDHGLTAADIAAPHWRIVAQGTGQICARCGELFYPTEDGQTLCAICRHKI